MSAPRRSTPAAPAGAAIEAAPARRVVQADVLELLRHYREAIELAAAPPASRCSRFGLMARALTSLRPTWGLQRLVAEHVRDRIALVDRHFARRLALGEADSNDDEDRAALSLFAASLPPPRSRLWAAVPLLAVVAVSQALIALLLIGRSDQRTPLSDAIRGLAGAADLSSGQMFKTVDTLLYSNPRITALAFAVLAASLYIVWRPLLPTVRLKRIILGMPAAISRRTARSELGERAQRLAVHDEELRLYAALGIRPPRESSLDLRVKLAPVAVLATLAGLLVAPPDPLWDLGAVLLAGALLRLAWIAHEARRRRPPAHPPEDARG